MNILLWQAAFVFAGSGELHQYPYPLRIGLTVSLTRNGRGKYAAQSLADHKKPHAALSKGTESIRTAVLNDKNAGGQRKRMDLAGHPERSNNCNADPARLHAEFDTPKEVGCLSSNMLFAGYLPEWMEIVKEQLVHATFGIYHGSLMLSFL